MFHPQGPTFVELARQALSSTQRGYDLLAPKFDYTPFRTPDVLLDAARARLEPLGPFDRALDICCGTGAGMAMLRPLCRRLVGLDFSQGMLTVGRERLSASAGTASLEWVRGDALQLPFAGAFDLAVCFGACGHILPRDEDRFVGEVARVLRPGGRFVFITSYPPRAGSVRWWSAHVFNAAMHVRNFLHSPPFIMYYLTFLLPGVLRLLEKQGFRPDVQPLVLGGRPSAYQLLVATRR